MNSQFLEGVRSKLAYDPTLNAWVSRTQDTSSSLPMSFSNNATAIYREQKSAWSLVLQLYTEAIRVAAEGGLSKVECPSIGESLNLHLKCYNAQKNLTTRGLLLAARICRVATTVFSIAALLFVVGAALHSIAFPITMTKIVLTLGLGVAGPGLQTLSKGFDKAASVWINLFFNPSNKRELSILREWHKIKNLKQIEEAINAFFDTHSQAKRIEEMIPDESKREEWNTGDKGALATLNDYREKINEYYRISPDLLYPSETSNGTLSIDPYLFRDLIQN